MADDEYIAISIRVLKSDAIEFRARLIEYGRQARAIRKFIKVFIMRAREASEDTIDWKKLVEVAAEETSAVILKGGLE